jgi:hypothetical protein
MDIWLLITIPVVVWIAVIVWLKPRGNKGGMVSRSGNDWQAPYWDSNASGFNSDVSVYSELGSGPKLDALRPLTCQAESLRHGELSLPLPKSVSSFSVLHDNGSGHAV